jgi:DNA-binding transcriptional MocR family regulator
VSPPIAALLGEWHLGSGPLYGRLAAAIEAAIGAGTLEAGARLPPERRLATALSISRRTVLAAYDELESRGLLVARQGSGTFVAGDAGPSGDAVVPDDSPVMRTLHGERSGVVDLSLAAPAALPMVAAALAGLTGSPELSAALRRTGYEPAGLPALRRAIAERLTAQGLPTGEEQVLVTTGAQQAIALLTALLVRPGQAVVVESPTYPGVQDVLRTAGARLLPVPIGARGVDPDAVRRAVQRGSAHLVHVTASFHNPTGTVVPAAARRDLARMAGELQVPVVEDTTLADLWLDTPPPPLVATFGAAGPVVTIGSTSKLFWGGLRVGWVRGSERLVASLARLKAIGDLGSSVVSQLAAARLVPLTAEAIEARRRELLPRRERLAALLAERLPEWTWRMPDGGLSLWATVPAGSAAELAEVALRCGVGIVPGAAFTPDETCRDRLRLTFASPVDTLELGVSRLAHAWQAYRAGARAARPPSAVV